MSDAYYPGWKAKIDGKNANVFPAQVLGKAIYVPSGEKTIEIYFESAAFILGRNISIFTVAVLLIGFLGVKVRKKRNVTSQ